MLGMTYEELEQVFTGDRIRHTIFGDGTVVRFGNGFQNSIVIDFDDHDEKELQLSFAAHKLTLI